MKSILLNIICIVLWSRACSQSPTVFIPFNNKHINYVGRIGSTDSCKEIFWTGSHWSLKIKGTKTVKALLADSHDNNYFYVVVDGQGSLAKKIRIDREKKFYTLAFFDDDDQHQVELFKITNTDDHITRFYGFEIDKNSDLIKPSKRPKRKIEFFGNSITCGHGVDVPADSTDSGAPEYFNNYWAYGAITARYFNAEYHCTAKSGIGIMVSWFRSIMPEIYDLVNPGDSNSKWDFEKYQPDIVVVNLFQNDSWLVNQPNNVQFKARFSGTKPSEEFIIDSYVRFIKALRSKYRKANIICTLGNMDATREESKWPGYVAAAVGALKDKKVSTHFFSYKNTAGHPKLIEQQAMAKSLISFIEKQDSWKKRK